MAPPTQRQPWGDIRLTLLRTCPQSHVYSINIWGGEGAVICQFLLGYSAVTKHSQQITRKKMFFLVHVSPAHSSAPAVAVLQDLLIVRHRQKVQSLCWNICIFMFWLKERVN